MSGAPRGRAAVDVWGLLERARRLHAGRPAVADGARRLAYAELAARARGLAAFLTQRLAPGERVAALLDNGLEVLDATFGAAGAGAVLVPLNTRLAPPELAAVLRDAEVRWVVCGAAHAARLAAALADGPGTGAGTVEGVLVAGGGAGALADRAGLALAEHELVCSADPWAAGGEGAWRPARAAPDAPAHLYYTSGTTGEPKGVVLTHGNVVTHALAAIAELGLGPRDTWGHLAPMFHLADAWATLAVTWVGGRHATLARFEERAALELLARERITVTNLVPLMLTRVLRLLEGGAAGRPDLSALRLLLSGGAPIAPDVVRDVVRAFGCEYAQTYGMTETSPYLTLSLPLEDEAGLAPEEVLRRRARTGRPFLAVELEVVDEAGLPVAADDRAVGEIRVRGATVTPGYWRRPEATAEVLRDGWLWTGDLATIDARGSVNIVDRRKDMILSGGENVYSTEVEHALYAHPEVLEAAVYGLPDATWGEVVCAAVVPRPGTPAARCLAGGPRPEEGASPAEGEARAAAAAAFRARLEAHCRERLAGYKVPRRVRVLAELPRTGSGKVAKRLLRADGAQEA